MTKVTNEYKCAEENRNQTEAPRFAQEKKAKGTELSKVIKLDELKNDNCNTGIDDDSNFEPVATANYSSIIQKRSFCHASFLT